MFIKLFQIFKMPCKYIEIEERESSNEDAIFIIYCKYRIDMSGGIEETLLLDKKNDNREKTRIWKIISRSRQLKSMSGAYIESDVNDPTDFRLSNGLVKGHAYSITKIASIYSSSGIETRLIRLRNPWGNLEWNGRWSDNSREWRYLTEQEKTNLEYKNINEGKMLILMKFCSPKTDPFLFKYLTLSRTLTSYFFERR
jgi:hypothetical protein